MMSGVGATFIAVQASGRQTWPSQMATASRREAHWLQMKAPAKAPQPLTLLLLIPAHILFKMDPSSRLHSELVALAQGYLGSGALRSRPIAVGGSVSDALHSATSSSELSSGLP